jgi:predicted MFS family arabinose efflux permease
MQSAASLARAIGPTIGGVLLNNAFNKLDDFTLYRTFWAASAIMFLAFLMAIYFASKNAELAANKHEKARKILVTNNTNEAE